MSTKYELKNLATGKTSLLDAISGTIGPDVINISTLTKDQGVFTFDPGFMATASTESKITYIDGDAGVLLYRGYPVEQLAEKSSFLEVATLLINGTLPSKTELDAFQNSIMRHTMVNEQLLRFFQGFHHDAHPMAMVSAVVASMSQLMTCAPCLANIKAQPRPIPLPIPVTMATFPFNRFESIASRLQPGLRARYIPGLIALGVD